MTGGAKRKRGGHPLGDDRAAVHVHEKPLDYFANQDDSDDDDYSDHAAASPGRSRRTRKSIARKSQKSARPSQRRPTKKPRREYSDSDVVSDSEPVDTDDPFSADELIQSPEPELNPRTGRPSRTAVRKAITYEESDVDDVPDELVEDIDTDSDSKPSLVVKFDLPSSKLRTVATAATGRMRSSRATSQAAQRAASEMRATRRSARQSHDPEVHLLELTNSGRHAQPADQTTSLPPESSKRPTRGGKGPAKGPAGKAPLKMPSKGAAKQPSLILEESNESSGVPGKDENDGELENAEDVLVESIEAHEVADSEPSQYADDRVEGFDEEDDADDDDEDEDGPIAPRRTRGQKAAAKPASASPQKRKRNSQSDEEFDPEEDFASHDGSEAAEMEPATREDSTESPPKRSRRPARRQSTDSQNESPDASEVHAELQDLERPRRSNRARQNNNGITYDDPPRSLRARANNISYNLLPQEVREADEASEAEQPGRAAPRAAAGGAFRSLFSVAGPFGLGGGNGRRPLFGPDAHGAPPLIGDDSSDDEGPARPPGLNPGLTPHTPNIGQPQKGDAVATGPAGLGRMTREGLADISPLGVPSDLGFDSVGGLDDHINKLKEMVLLPLLYPELYAKWKVPPPRGVLFHGPPGTGKTLVARALASSVLVGDKKVTFYMRKGSDVMSKWVGEAERQLRLLFEEAKKNQPSIIFFDEFDGLAPVRSSKQEQTHSSIVATLLALMDGMDNRGQVVVVGATNRPDSIDPAFRRPGRFDREFYFPLPNKEARRAIIDIHTRNWDPALQTKLKDELAEMTKGYGGADLRALCTEAVINAVQRTYPQIYRSDKKLLVDTSTIQVAPKDFIISMQKITPSSKRSQASIADPLPKEVEPLLRQTFAEVSQRLDDAIPPQKKQLTALEEAEYDDPDDNLGFEHLEVFRAFEKRRVFRPRLLINGVKGMGQKYLASAMLQKLDNFFVRAFDLPSLLGDAVNSPESAMISMFQEVRVHQPSVIFIPQVNAWYRTVSPQLLETFSSLLRTLSANDAVLVLGVMETDGELERPDPMMLRDIFGFSTKIEYQITRPSRASRYEFFEPLISCLRKRPSEFPDPENRKKRKLPELPVVQEEPKLKPPPTKAELKAQKKADEQTTNMFRMNLLPIIKEMKNGWRLFQKSVVSDKDIEYLLKEQDADYVTSDLSEEQRQQQQVLRPYEVGVDRHGVRGLRDTVNNKFYYNLNTLIIDARVSTGAYKRPKDFLHDIRSILKDVKTFGTPETILKANNMYGFAMAEMSAFEIINPQLAADCEAVYAREQERARLEAEKQNADPSKVQNVIPSATESSAQTGPILLGESVHIRPELPPPITPPRPGPSTNGDQQSNGTTIPSQAADYTPMDLIDDSSSGNRPQFPPGSVMTPSGPTTQPYSQRSAIEKMAPGTQVTDYQNSASTTTSGHKTSDGSNRTSDRSRFGANTQSTNGATQPESQHYPDFDELLPPIEGGSQIPDTQSTSSVPISARPARHLHETQNSSSQSSASQANQFPKPALPAHVIAAQHSQAADDHTGLATAPPSSMVQAPLSDTNNRVHHPHTSNITNVLNPPEPLPPFVINEVALRNMHDDLASRTEGLTVEQIEMVMARCMDIIWKSKHMWDRTGVVDSIRDAVDDVLADVLWQNGLAMEGHQWTGGRSPSN